MIPRFVFSLGLLQAGAALAESYPAPDQGHFGTENSEAALENP